ncbi:MAG: ABC transporter permease [Lentisphaeria bacterium]|nr:ABC transporter permease [Lentisphaeria bacterium]
MHDKRADQFLSSAVYFIEQTGDNVYSLLKDLKDFTRFTGDMAEAICHLIRHPSTLRRRETLYYMNMCGPDALPISILICLLMGLIIGYQSAVQMHKYGADMFLAPLVGCSIVRELGPLMIAIIATGRAGSAFTAEIATMKSTEEINAMLTMGFSPWRFLVIPKLLSMMVMVPILTLIGDIVGIIGGMMVGVFSLGIPAQTYYQQTVDWVSPEFFLESVVKGFVFSIIITSIACMRGFQAKDDALGVGRATTASVVTGIIAVIVADFMMAKMFNVLFYGA